MGALYLSSIPRSRGLPVAGISVQFELYRLSYRVVPAVEHGYKRIRTRRGTAPLFAETNAVLGAEQSVLHCLREQPSFAPLPDFATGAVEHNEVVRIAIGEVEFNTASGAIVHRDYEAYLTGSCINGHACRHDGVGAGFCPGTAYHGLSARSTCKKEDSGSQQRDGDAGEHQVVERG